MDALSVYKECSKFQSVMYFDLGEENLLVKVQYFENRCLYLYNFVGA